MICVSIGRGRHRHMIAEHGHLVEIGAQLVELRLDYINGDVNIRRLLADRKGPVLISCRRESDGGKWAGSEEARQTLLRTAVAEGVDYIDLEDDIASTIPRFGQTKRVISRHDFRKTPEDLKEIHARMAELDADIIKLATLANHPHDNVRMLKLVEESEIPTVGICMGDIGTPSRLLAGKFGSPFTFATFHHERALAPGQLSFQEMNEVYRYEQINRETTVFGVIADPIGHSHSPLIHNAAFAEQDVNSVYLPFRVRRQDLASFMDDAKAMGIKGLSVTIPHKESVLRHLTKLDGAARRVSAVNTVVFGKEGIIGYNTDYRAAIESLEDGMGGKKADGTSPVMNKTALILGAGGVAKVFAHALRRRKAHVIIASRTSSRADNLAEQAKCKAIDWSARHGISADVLINCTPVGMHPNVDETPFDRHHMRPSMVVFDTVYNPESTLFIKDARARSCVVVTGVDMFIRQAALQYKLFTGEEAPMPLMRETLKRATGAARVS